MFGIGYSELLLIAVIALVVIGPKDLPRVMRQVGRFVGKAQGMARHFRAGIDTMIREAELEEMEKKWREENERIMRDHPLLSPGAGMLPLGNAAPTALPPAEPPVAEEQVAPPAPEPASPELPLGGPDVSRRELP
jgi:sec-independent protein translocase protein TatB